jgi:hypothetical protein
MAEGNWRCGMCAAHNEPSKHACMVCDTLRVLGARGSNPDPGDLLASTQSMFGEQRGRPVTAPTVGGENDPARARVMESPPVRAVGGARAVRTARPEEECAADAGQSQSQPWPRPPLRGGR